MKNLLLGLSLAVTFSITAQTDSKIYDIIDAVSEELLRNNVNEFILKGIVIDDFFFNIAAVANNGYESEVAFSNKIMP